MLGYMTTFFILAVIAGVIGFGRLMVGFDEIAQFLSLIFIMFFLASVMYGAGAGSPKNTPPL